MPRVRIQWGDYISLFLVVKSNFFVQNFYNCRLKSIFSMNWLQFHYFHSPRGDRFWYFHSPMGDGLVTHGWRTRYPWVTNSSPMGDGLVTHGWRIRHSWVNDFVMVIHGFCHGRMNLLMSFTHGWSSHWKFINGNFTTKNGEMQIA